MYRHRFLNVNFNSLNFLYNHRLIYSFKNLFFRFSVRQCSDLFGSEYNLKSINDSIKAVNRNFGGLNYQGTRVVFVNGNIDPVHVYSFYTHAPNPLTKIVYINGTSHCQDMFFSLPTDSIELTNARHNILSLIKKWLSE